MVQDNPLPNIDWRFLDGRVTSYRQRFSLKSKSAALTFLALERLFDLGEDDIRESITDNGNDCGIDAVVIRTEDSKTEINLFQTKYHESTKGTERNFPSSEAPKILNFLNMTLADDIDFKNHTNPALSRKIEDIKALFAADNPSITIWLCSNGAPLAKAEKTKFLSLLNKFDFIDLKEISLSEIAHLASNKRKKRSNQKKMSVLEDAIFERSDGDIRGIVATIQVETLVNLIKDPANPEMVDKDLFDDNIRVYLGRKNEVNTLIFAIMAQNQQAQLRRFPGFLTA